MNEFAQFQMFCFKCSGQTPTRDEEKRERFDREKKNELNCMRLNMALNVSNPFIKIKCNSLRLSLCVLEPMHMDGSLFCIRLYRPIFLVS